MKPNYLIKSKIKKKLFLFKFKNLIIFTLCESQVSWVTDLVLDICVPKAL